MRVFGDRVPAWPPLAGAVALLVSALVAGLASLLSAIPAAIAGADRSSPAFVLPAAVLSAAGVVVEPVTADDKPGQAQMRAATDIPIASGESEFTRHDFRDLAVLQAVDIMQPDLAICGGITEAMRISAIAGAFNLKLAPHLWAGAPAFAAGLHLAASSSAGFILEYSLGHNPMLHDLVEEDFPVVDGQVEIPDRPGLGITVRESFLQQYGRTA